MKKERSYIVVLSVAISVLITVLIIACSILLFPLPQTLNIKPSHLPAQNYINEEYDQTLIAQNTVPTVPDTVERVLDAVVSVVVTQDIPIIERYYERVPGQDMFGRRYIFSIPKERSVGTEKREVGSGSGFFVSSDGYLVTNYHVVRAHDTDFSVITNDGSIYPATVVGADPVIDIAVLKIATSSEPFPYLTFASPQKVRLGETAIAIGNALGDFPNTVSVGVVSGLSRSIIAGDNTTMNAERLEGVIQTDAAINPGNSGGPLLNIFGEVIGVNVAVAGSSENIGFAIPGDVAKHTYERVRAGLPVARPFLGIRYRTITKTNAESLGVPVQSGVVIVGDATHPAVIPNSAAERAGLQEGDVITAVDGMPLDGRVSFSRRIQSHAVGEVVTLNILRGGETLLLSVPLTAQE